MNFDLSEDQRLFEETVNRYFANEFPLGSVREVFDGDVGASDVLWKGLAALGVLGILVPEEHGGLGLELLDLALAAECLGYAAAPGPFLEHVLAALAITMAGSRAQQARWLPGLADGTLRATVALAEPSGWRPEGWTFPTTGAANGSKQFVLNPAGADVVVVAGAGGMGLVEGHAAGIAVQPLEPLDRTRRLAHVRFDSVAVEPLPGGDAALPRVIDAALVLLAADASGGARRCVELSVAYANEREQFGVTIGHFQALKHQLADMALEVEPARGLYWYAAHAFDHEPGAAGKFAALAKSHLTDRYVEVGRRAVEAHGGIGYTWECDVHFFLKRAVLDRTYLGRPSVHRQRVAAVNGWT